MEQASYEAFFANGNTYHMDNPHQKHVRVSMKKRLSRGDIEEAGLEEADSNPTEEQLWEHDSFYKDTKSLLVLFQIMGVMPIERSGLGSTTWKWFSKTTMYAYTLFTLETIYVTIVFKERLNITLQKGKRFDEYIYNFIFLSILVPHFLLPIAAWKNGPEVAIYKNMWTNIQTCIRGLIISDSLIMYPPFWTYSTHLNRLFRALFFGRYKYYRVIGKTIRFRRLEGITWTLCVLSWAVGAAVMLAQFYLQPDLLFWHTLAYYHILAMMDCLCSLWFINCRAQGAAARGLTKSLQRALESADRAVQVARCRDLWVDLSHLMQQLGRAYSGMYGMYCILILLTTIVASYGFLSEVLDHGFSFKEIGFLLIATYTMAILYIICNEAYFASKKMGTDIQERLLNVNFAGLDSDSRMEIGLFLTAIEKNPPTMNLNGFADVNRRLVTTVVSSMGTYLVMLMQFKLSLSRSASLGNSTRAAAPYNSTFE